MSTTPKPIASIPAAKPAVAAVPVARVPVPSSTAPHAAEAEEEEEYEEAPKYNTRFILFNAVPSWAISGVVHFIALIVLAFIELQPPVKSQTAQVVSAPVEQIESIEELPQESQMNLDVNTNNVSNEISNTISGDLDYTPDAPSPVADVDSAAVSVALSDVSDITAMSSDISRTIGAVSGKGVDGRGEGAKKALITKGGGTDASEAAVAKALQWLAMHQLQDGGWNFDHRGGLCAGKCANPGTMGDCRTGATAMALLPFLGSGQTHKQGKYKKTVEQGLYFLSSQMKVTGKTGSLVSGGGSMYSHGISAIVLCEAYAMTKDKALLGPAQLSLNFIVDSQDPVGGGWRYVPRQPGDTSAVGWQLMALKSGHMSYLQVPGNTIVGASKFLDSVQVENGAKYGYTEPGASPTLTAVGLLCRMYLGWKRENPALMKGVEYLSSLGPSKTNMYYNYYATQVLRQYEGEMWDKWNKEMRDYLVESQSKEAHQLGSWHMAGDDHGAAAGGRLYCTSMSTMILEVYYRHMPLYKEAASSDEFPLN